MSADPGAGSHTIAARGSEAHKMPNLSPTRLELTHICLIVVHGVQQRISLATDALRPMSGMVKDASPMFWTTEDQMDTQER